MNSQETFQELVKFRKENEKLKQKNAKLVEALEESNSFIDSLIGACWCDEADHYKCRSCNAIDLGNKIDKILKEAKGE